MKKEARIIPVMDIMNSQVVHAIAGERDRYEPIRSKIVEGSEPVEVAEAFRRTFDVNEIYIADLDAISSSGDNLSSVIEVLETSEVRVMLDAGVSSKTDVERLLGHGIPRVVVATETIESPEALSEIAESHPVEVVGSLDMKNGRILSASAEFRGQQPGILARFMEASGFQELIVLELALVGSGKGPVHPGLVEVRRNTNIKTIAGGGVRNRDDLRELHSLGIEAVLVATALHNGSIQYRHS
ncbi:MAG: HisA/HisF-related TIM barrel protein [Candidatus Thorarchaeota archaeon]